jgi:hypothetical protein
MMTDAEHALLIAMCQRAVECWTAGDEHNAEKWFAGALEVLPTTGGEFVDTDDQACR